MALTSRRSEGSAAAARSPSCTSMLRAFIRGPSPPAGALPLLPLDVEGVHRRTVDPDGADAPLDLEPDEVGHASDPGPAPGAPSSPWPPVIDSCHMCTAESTSWVVTCSSTATSDSGDTTCSPVTTRVLLAMPALTMLSRRVRSLQACSWVSR